MITATLHFAIAGSVVRGLLCVLFILFSCCIFLISSVLTKKIAYDRLIRCLRSADMFKSEKQYTHSSASSIFMQDSQTKAKTPRCVCVRCIMHVVEFHYVPQSPQSLGDLANSAAVTIVRFETAVPASRPILPTRRIKPRLHAVLLLHNFDPFPCESENDY